MNNKESLAFKRGVKEGLRIAKVGIKKLKDSIEEEIKIMNMDIRGKFEE